MKFKSTAIICSALIVVGSLFAFNKGQQETTEYMTILSMGEKNGYVKISSAGEFKELLLNKESKANYDYNPIMRLLAEYEKEGWVVIENEFQSYPSTTNYFLLQRKK